VIELGWWGSLVAVALFVGAAAPGALPVAVVAAVVAPDHKVVAGLVAWLVATVVVLFAVWLFYKLGVPGLMVYIPAWVVGWVCAALLAFGSRRW
jgi:hypothetical protein